jgi:uncharacterized membrane protein YkgB
MMHSPRNTFAHPAFTHHKTGENRMHNIFYIIGVIVVILAVLSFAGIA